MIYTYVDSTQLHTQFLLWTKSYKRFAERSVPIFKSVMFIISYLFCHKCLCGNVLFDNVSLSYFTDSNLRYILPYRSLNFSVFNKTLIQDYITEENYYFSIMCQNVCLFIRNAFVQLHTYGYSVFVRLQCKFALSLFR